jgi:hypothetical protein
MGSGGKRGATPCGGTGNAEAGKVSEIKIFRDAEKPVRRARAAVRPPITLP